MKRLFSFLVVLITISLINLLAAQDPYHTKDNTWITIEGTIVTTAPENFELDYGKGIVIVEMDGWDWYSKQYSYLPGDEVIVNGFVDDDLYELTSIEAASVYVKDLNTYFYANPKDEEGMAESYVSFELLDSDVQITGIVTSTRDREFTIDTGNRRITVETLNMPYNPLDDKGFQKIEKGDYVQVSGDMDYDFYEAKEIMAKSVITLVEDATKNK